MNDRDPLRVGVIGAGAISQIIHLPILRERTDVDVVALADVDAHKAETLSRRFGVPLVMSTDELLDFDELDAIVVCTPNHLHDTIAIAGLDRGKDVLVERPLATTAAGAAGVVEAAERSDRVLGVGLPHRFRPEVIALRSFVEGGELGELHSMRGSWLARSVPMVRAGWRANRGEAGGGALIDLGIPALDLCMWVIGFPDAARVRCVLSSEEGDDVEHSATLLVETTDGLVLSLEVSSRLFASEDRYYVRVMGSDGSGSLPPLEVFKLLGGRPIDVTPRQPTPRGGENPYTNAYRRLLDDFVRRACGLGEPSLPREQVGLMALVEAAYRSAEEGREVEP